MLNIFVADLSRLKYNDFYFASQEQGFQFVRKKSEDTANEGEGTEVIIPIIEPLRNILDRYATPPQKDAYVFPFILGEDLIAKVEKAEAVVGDLAIAVSDRMKQENHNIGDHMKKIAKSLGWNEVLSGTWARHSFATNMFNMGVPKHYISDAMGHTVENRGDITERYISAYTLEKRMEYNYMLLGIDYGNGKEDIEEQLSARQELYSMMDNFFGLMKNELLYVNNFESIESFESELKKYITWYNTKRIKLRLKGMSPAQYRAHYYRDFNY